MLETQNLHYRDLDLALTGFMAFDPAAGERRPGVLVVHGGAGLDDHAKGRARRIAEHGYVVFACDMYGDGVAGNRDKVLACISTLRSDPGILCRRAEAGIDVLRSHPMVDGRLAAVGYCFGGMTVLELARNGTNLVGAVSVHGSLETSQHVHPGAIKARILVCHGALDPHVPPDHVRTFEEEMIRVQADWQLFIYGTAMHGFTHETATGQQRGVKYDALTDQRSSKAIQTFFSEIFSY